MSFHELIDSLNKKKAGFWIQLVWIVPLFLSLAMSDWSLSTWWFGEGGYVGVWGMIKGIGFFVLMCGLPAVPFGVWFLGAKHFLRTEDSVGWRRLVSLDGEKVVKHVGELSQDDWNTIEARSEFSEFYRLREAFKDYRETKWRRYGLILVTTTSVALCLYVFVKVAQYSWSL